MIHSVQVWCKKEQYLLAFHLLYFPLIVFCSIVFAEARLCNFEGGRGGQCDIGKNENEKRTGSLISECGFL